MMFKKTAEGEYKFSTRFWIYALIATSLIVWIGWRTQLTANKVEVQARETAEFSRETQDCLNQLIDVLAKRGDLNNDRDNLSEHQRLEFLNMFKDLLAPPANIAALPANDPVRQKWSENIANKYVRSISDDQDKVNAIRENIKDHPIPAPVCGVNPPEPLK